MIFARKMPEFYIIIVRKIFFPIFFWGGGACAPPANCLLRPWIFWTGSCDLLGYCVCGAVRDTDVRYDVMAWFLDDSQHLQLGFSSQSVSALTLKQRRPCNDTITPQQDWQLQSLNNKVSPNLTLTPMLQPNRVHLITRPRLSRNARMMWLLPKPM